MFSFFNKSESEIVAVFDIGNGSVGGALVMLNKSGIPTILYTHRAPLAYFPHATSNRLLESMLKLLGTVAEHIKKEGVPFVKKSIHVHSIKHAYCVLSSPWYLSQTQIKVVQADAPFEITQKYIDELVKEEEDHFITLLKGGWYEKLFGNDCKVFEKKIIHTRLNGYEIDDPRGKKVKELEITFFSSYISQSLTNVIESTLHHHFRFKSIHFNSYALASWNAVRDMHPDTKDFLFVDITGEVTDIMLTQNGILYESLSFPLGRSMVLRKIVDKLDVPPVVAVSFLSILAMGTLDKEFTQKMKNILKETQDFWISSFVKTVIKLKAIHILPKKIYISADEDVISFFYEALSKKVPEGLNIPINGFEIIVLNTENVKPLANIAGGVRKDIFLSIDSEFLNKTAFDIV